MRGCSSLTLYTLNLSSVLLLAASEIKELLLPVSVLVYYNGDSGFTRVVMQKSLDLAEWHRSMASQQPQ